MASQTEPASTPFLGRGFAPYERSKVESVERLDQLLDDLQRQGAASQPLIAELVPPGKGTLAIGLGLDDTVLSYTPASRNPPYLRTAGPNEHGSDLVFFYYGEWTEFPREQAIPLSEAREAIRRFYREGALPSQVKWVEV